LKELSILKLFTEKKDTFEQYGVYLRKMDNLDGSISILLRCIQEYYDKYVDHTYIGQDELWSFYDYMYPNNKERQMHLELINRMYKLEVSTDIMTDLLEQATERYYASQVVGKLLPVLEGQKFDVLPYIQTEIDEFIGLMKNPPKDSLALDPCTMSPAELIVGRANLVGAPWHLETLNAVLGPATMGTLGVVFAFVDGGKTSFTLSAMKSFAEYYADTGEVLAYCINEESAQRISERSLSAFTGKSRVELEALYPEGHAELLEEANELIGGMGWHRLKIVDGIEHLANVKKVLEDWNPRVMIIDQGSKVATDFNAKDIKETRLLYGTYRRFAREYDCAIICVEQAVGDAEDRQWINLSDIYGSRVAIQGELDYAIGIGKKLEKGRENFRYINVSKNKLKDGITTSFTTYFDKERCIWRPV
jgi:hypothetical protein